VRLLAAAGFVEDYKFSHVAELSVVRETCSISKLVRF